MAETILITGANRGLGLGLAALCLAHGHTVIAAARDTQSPGLADLQARYGERLARMPLDVTEAASVAGLASALGDRPVDVLVNNAGIIGPHRQSTLDMDFAGFLHTLDVNTLGPLRVTQAVLPNLRRGARPRILILSSRMGSLSHAKSDRIAYRASKAAVNKVMQGLATDLQPMGVAIASAHPGWVRTDMGGPEADIDTQESVDGLYVLIMGLTLERTGSFFNYDGTTMPW
jgi:NAD(P)-dependent dehydrogenase (short-subunit alcohol dehydrogenase family)